LREIVREILEHDAVIARLDHPERCRVASARAGEVHDAILRLLDPQMFEGDGPIAANRPPGAEHASGARRGPILLDARPVRAVLTPRAAQPRKLIDAFVPDRVCRLSTRRKDDERQDGRRDNCTHGDLRS
jgi:hypothetical protein